MLFTGLRRIAVVLDDARDRFFQIRKIPPYTRNIRKFFPCYRLSLVEIKTLCEVPFSALEMLEGRRG